MIHAWGFMIHAHLHDVFKTTHFDASCRTCADASAQLRGMQILSGLPSSWWRRKQSTMTDSPGGTSICPRTPTSSRSADQGSRLIITDSRSQCGWSMMQRGRKILAGCAAAKVSRNWGPFVGLEDPMKLMLTPPGLPMNSRNSSRCSKAWSCMYYLVYWFRRSDSEMTRSDRL